MFILIFTSNVLLNRTSNPLTNRAKMKKSEKEFFSECRRLFILTVFILWNNSTSHRLLLVLMLTRTTVFPDCFKNPLSIIARNRDYLSG